MEFLKAAPRTDLHVSVSQVRQMMACGHRYYLRHVLGVEPEHRGANLALGSAVHEALAAYYSRIRNGHEPVPEGILATFSDAFDEEAAKEPAVLLDEGETLGQLKDVGVGLVQAQLLGNRFCRAEGDE